MDNLIVPQEIAYLRAQRRTRIANSIRRAAIELKLYIFYDLYSDDELQAMKLEYLRVGGDYAKFHELADLEDD